MAWGPDGHTASLFPNTDALHEIGRLVVANYVPQKDTWRITLTWPVINQAAEVAFEVEGPGKADIVAEVLTGPRDPERLPSQLIRPRMVSFSFCWIRTLRRSCRRPARLPKRQGYRVGTLEI